MAGGEYAESDSDGVTTYPRRITAAWPRTRLVRASPGIILTLALAKRTLRQSPKRLDHRGTRIADSVTSARPLLPSKNEGRQGSFVEDFTMKAKKGRVRTCRLAVVKDGEFVGWLADPVEYGPMCRTIIRLAGKMLASDGLQLATCPVILEGRRAG